MKVTDDRGKFHKTVAAAVMVLTLTGCSTVEIQKERAQPALAYSSHTEFGGLVISVEPYTEKDRLVKFFGCDLVARGVLPVLVVIENVEAGDGYVLLKENSTLVMQNPDLNSPGGIPGNANAKAKAAYESARATETVAGLLMSPLLGVLSAFYGNEFQNEVTILENLRYKELAPKTIYRGGAQNGFLYFKFDRKEDLEHLTAVRVDMKNVRTGEIVALSVKIKTP